MFRNVAIGRTCPSGRTIDLRENPRYARAIRGEPDQRRSINKGDVCRSYRWPFGQVLDCNLQLTKINARAPFIPIRLAGFNHREFIFQGTTEKFGEGSFDDPKAPRRPEAGWSVRACFHHE